MKRKVSIIMPAYNVEKSVGASIDSVMNQTYTNLELIVVDDGSTDNTVTICEGYAKIHKNIKLIQQENAGVSSARNKGIEESTGDYVTFIDADDWLESDAVEKMVSMLEKHDVDCVRTKCNIASSKSIFPMRQRVVSGIYGEKKLYNLQYASATGDLLCYVYLLLIKRDILVKNNLKFPIGISMMEDMWFYIDLLSKVTSVYISNEITYNYTVNENGASRSMHGFKDKVSSIVAVNRHLHEQKFSSSQLRYIDSACMSCVTNLVMVRADRAGKMQDVYDMIETVSDNVDVQNIYGNANMAKLSLYNRIASWAVVRNSKILVRTLMIVRKVMGK